MKTIKIPTNVLMILNRIHEAGFEAYIVGGCVRDFLLGRHSHDWDITTSAKPDKIKSIFSKYKRIEFGEKHGTIGIYIKGQIFEITTFREESEYSDGRHPDRVEFITSLSSDLSRRDFTINAMAADRSGKIIDLVNGMEDFNNKLIRTVGEPIKRFTEDSLRMLRAVRFALRLEYEIEINTYNAIIENVNLMKVHKLARERIITELEEIVLYGDKSFELLNNLGILKTIFPFFGNLESINSTLQALKYLSSNNPDIYFSVWFHFVSIESSLPRKFFDGIIEFLKGMKRTRQLIIRQMALNARIPDEIFRTGSRNLINFWMHRVNRELTRFPEYDHHQFISDLIIVNQACYPSMISDERDKFTKTLIDNTSIGLPELNGKDAIKMGFESKYILDVLEYWKILKYNDPQITGTQLKEFTKKFASPIITVIDEERNLGDDSLEFSDLSNQFLNFFINIQLNLSSNFKALQIVISTFDELKIIKIKNKHGLILVLVDQEKSNGALNQSISTFIGERNEYVVDRFENIDYLNHNMIDWSIKFAKIVIVSDNIDCSRIILP
jgi:tRNA nucleotidyltransferase/poly(A) polymerase